MKVIARYLKIDEGKRMKVNEGKLSKAMEMARRTQLGLLISTFLWWFDYCSIFED